MRRLVCLVEGHGELKAAPILCNRVIRTILKKDNWFVDEEPVRQPRSRYVDETIPSPGRPANIDGIQRALALAAARDPQGILLICDADDDCPAAWIKNVPRFAPCGEGKILVRAVMANREFESWLLWGFSSSERIKVGARNPEKSPRNAKKALADLVPGYAPTLNQGIQTRRLDLASIWAASDSFDKFVRSTADLVGVECPLRPPPSAS